VAEIVEPAFDARSNLGGFPRLFPTAIALLASVYFMDIFATLFLIPELRGKPLD
jgi:hypothetical protein